MRTLTWLLFRMCTWPFVLGFGGSSGPAPTVTPIAPPASLFPGTTSAIQEQGPGAINTATKAFSGAAGGVDVGKIYESIVAASKRGTAEGQANLTSAMGASGMAASSDAMRASADYQLQSQANLLQQLQTMQFQNEGIKLGGAQGLMETYGNAGMAFAPTQVVNSSSAGPSAFSQFTTAATGSAMALAMLLMACWVAAELYGGWDSFEVFSIRHYLANRKGPIGKAFVFLYIRFGQRVAAHIKTHSTSRRAVKLLFDWLLSQTFTWRLSCRSQA